MPRIPLIKFPKRHPKVSSVSPPTDQNAFVMSQLGAKSELKSPPSSGEIKNHHFRSDVPAPHSNTVVGGPASLLSKRTPLSEEEIEAIMLGGSF